MVYSRQAGDPKHLIQNGASFAYLDPVLGRMGPGDLKAEVILNGPAAEGDLMISWQVDGVSMGISGVPPDPPAFFSMGVQLVTPNTVASFGREPIRGRYRVILLRNDAYGVQKEVASYAFRITR